MYLWGTTKPFHASASRASMIAVISARSFSSRASRSACDTLRKAWAPRSTCSFISRTPSASGTVVPFRAASKPTK